jgi:hypothetical protein
LVGARSALTPSQIVQFNNMYRTFFLQKDRSASDLPQGGSTNRLTSLTTFALEAIFDKINSGKPLTFEEAKDFGTYRESQLSLARFQTLINDAHRGYLYVDFPTVISQFEAIQQEHARTSAGQFEAEVRSVPKASKSITDIIAQNPAYLGNMMTEIVYGTNYDKTFQKFTDGKETDTFYSFPVLCEMCSGKKRVVASNEDTGLITLTPELMISDVVALNTAESKRLVGMELGKLASKIILEPQENQKRLIFGKEGNQELTEEEKMFLDVLVQGKEEVLQEYYENGILQTKMVKEQLAKPGLGADLNLSEEERIRKVALERYSVESDLNRRNADVIVLNNAKKICDKHKDDRFFKKWRIKREIKGVYEEQMKKQLQQKHTYQYQYEKARKELSGKSGIEANPIMKQARTMVRQYSAI